MPPLRWTGVVPVEGGEVYVESTGHGDAVVFVHGSGANHAVWFAQLADLSPDHRVITYDARGAGRTTAPAGSLTAGPGDLLAVLDALDVDRAHVVAHSAGGWAAVGAALLRPARVTSLLLLDTVAGLAAPELDAFWEDFASRFTRPLPDHGALGTTVPTDLADRHPARAVLYQQITSLNPAADPPLRTPPTRETFACFPVASVAALDVQLAFVVGEHDETFPPEAVAAAAGLTGGHYEVLPGVGHSPYFEDPGLTNTSLRDWILKCPATSSRSASPDGRRSANDVSSLASTGPVGDVGSTARKP